MYRKKLSSEVEGVSKKIKNDFSKVVK